MPGISLLECTGRDNRHKAMEIVEALEVCRVCSRSWINKLYKTRSYLKEGAFLFI